MTTAALRSRHIVVAPGLALVSAMVTPRAVSRRRSLVIMLSWSPSISHVLLHHVAAIIVAVRCLGVLRGFVEGVGGMNGQGVGIDKSFNTW
jgi:hypothetical protein